MNTNVITEISLQIIQISIHCTENTSDCIFSIKSDNEKSAHGQNQKLLEDQIILEILIETIPMSKPIKKKFPKILHHFHWVRVIDALKFSFEYSFLLTALTRANTVLFDLYMI